MANRICAYCAAETANVSWPLRIKKTGFPMETTNNVEDLIKAANDGALIESANGMRLGIIPVTMWKGSDACNVHALILIQEQNRSERIANPVRARY